MDYNTAPAAFITNAKLVQKNSRHGERSRRGECVEKLAIWIRGIGGVMGGGVALVLVYFQCERIKRFEKASERGFFKKFTSRQTE